MAGMDDKVVIPIELQDKASSQLRELSETFRKLADVASGAGKKAKEGLDFSGMQLEGPVKSATQNMIGLAAGVATGAAAFAVLASAAKGFAGFLKDSMHEYLEAELVLQRLSVMVNNTGGNFAEAKPQLSAWTEEIKKISSLSTTQIQVGLTSLLVHTQDLGRAQKLSALAMNIAAATGKDYLEVVNKLGLALEGSTRGLREFGLTTELAGEGAQKTFMAMTEAQKAQFILLAGNEKFANSSRDLLSTNAQQLQLLKNSIKELKEAVGEALSGPLAGFVGWLATVVKDATTAIGVLQMLYAGMPGGGSGGVKRNESWDPDSGETSAQWLARMRAKKPAVEGSEEDPAKLIARIRRLQEAEEATKKFNEAVKALTGDDVAFAVSQQVLAKALGDITKRFGDANEVARLWASELAAVELAAAKTGTAINANLKQFMFQGPDLSGAMRLKQAFEDKEAAAKNAKEVLDWFLKAGEGITEFLKTDQAKEWARQAAQEMASTLKKMSRQLQGDLVKTFGDALGPIFADLATTGGKNFGQIAAATFSQATTQGADSLVGMLAQLLGGIGGKSRAKKGTDAQGNAIWTVEGSDQEFLTQQGADAAGNQIAGKDLIGKGVAAAQFATLAASSISGKQHVSDLSLIAQGATTGFTVGGGALGAVIGAVVGAFAAVLSPQKGDSYKYVEATGTQVGILAGTAAGRFNKNVSEAETLAFLRSIQETYDSFRNGYIGLLEDLDVSFTDELWKANREFLASYTHRGAGASNIVGDIGAEASALFAEKLKNWVDETLPEAIAETFKGEIGRGFEALDFTLDAFEEIWDHLSLLDRKKQISLLSTLAIAGREIKDALEFFATEVAPTKRIALGVGGASYDQYTNPAGGGLLAQVAAEARRSFAQIMAETDEEILKLGANLNNLVGEDQINRAKTLGDMMTQRMQDEKAFLLSIQQGMKAITDSIGQSVRSLTLEGFRTLETDAQGNKSYKTDYGGQAQYLKEYADDLMAQLALATNPQEVQALTGQIQQTIMQIRSIGGQLGPEADELYRKWALEQLKTVEKTAHAQMMKLAKDVEDQNKAFVNAIQGFIDAFRQATVDIREYIPPGTPVPPTLPPGENVPVQLGPDGLPIVPTLPTGPTVDPERGAAMQEHFDELMREQVEANLAFMKEFGTSLTDKSDKGTEKMVDLLGKIHGLMEAGREVRVVMDDLNITVDSGGGDSPDRTTRTIRGRV